MLCYLQSAELRPRDGKLPFFICKWSGVQGDVNAEQVKEENGLFRINIKAATARTISLTKSIFPVDEAALNLWKQNLKCRVMYVPKKDDKGNYIKDDNGNYVLNEKIVDENANKTVINLIYKQVPLKSISEDVKKIEFTTSDGRVLRQDYVTVIGFADEHDIWAEEQTPEQMALTNLNTNLSNGTYLDVSDEVDTEEKQLHSKSKTGSSDWD